VANLRMPCSMSSVMLFLRAIACTSLRLPPSRMRLRISSLSWNTSKIPVRPLVGPSSLLLAVMASGLNGQSFAFNGYLPTDAEARSKRIRQLEDRSRKEKQTQLLIETPYRNGAMLEALAQSCQPGTLICVATDLSLPTETVRTQTATQWKAALAANKAPDFHKKPTVFLLLAE